MKTVKQILGVIALAGVIAFSGMLAAARGSGITGIPQILSLTSLTASGSVTAASHTSAAGAPLVLNAPTGQNINLQSNGSTFASIGKAGTESTSNPIFYGVTGSTVTSGRMYALYLSLDTAAGQECVTLAGSPALPPGWSLNSTVAGICTITFPAVTTANKVVPIITAQAVGWVCSNSNTSSTTTVVVKCQNTATDTEANTPFAILIMDWN